MPEAQRVWDTLRESSPLFVTQLLARSGVDSATVEAVLVDAGGRSMIVSAHSSPDPHITADLRVVALVNDNDVAQATADADRLWSEWLRGVLQMHRCA